ncbi:hypothetical protein GJ700_06170 [Duganella sp. FT92W]|uniref:Lysozyme inhibitor LprI-like N-terminal domain-containing protein n=1 Tax=Pseudoduganella rivuli TaxID=2666085 RepID=A0A7X2IK42_9BURK|nr:lysozyme inhibitor LprI family protein [Pseudoduganella rivuli]MRV71305.1 hypothetical protein [Pseudoduganella rivuli]
MKRVWVSAARAAAVGWVAMLPAMAQPPEYPNTSAMGSLGDTNAVWYRQCMAVQHVQPPARDLPAASALHGLRHCGAQDRYYDTRERVAASPLAWDQVRHCAVAEHDAAVLMMLYANGYGVSRNHELALKYACSMPAAPAEMDARVAHLKERTDHHDPAVFDQCDDVTSSHMGTFCAAIQERLDSRERNGKVVAIIKAWPLAQQAVAAKLQAALDVFAASRADQETDMSGGLRAALAIEARGFELDQFARDLQEAEKGHLPRYTPQQYQQLERKLGDVFERLMERRVGQPGSHLVGHGTVTKDGVRITQQAWQAYRDAWVALGAARYPNVAPHAWKALLTQRRIEQLAEFES